ncbi:MAG: hypothetical protein ISN28_04555 [Ectothiorhodospiraceae bacterium AqS1]|nr:hypothetical protein [Ectothiorhodospiraceae bacterium AqS1]
MIGLWALRSPALLAFIARAHRSDRTAARKGSADALALALALALID